MDVNVLLQFSSLQDTNQIYVHFQFPQAIVHDSSIIDDHIQSPKGLDGRSKSFFELSVVRDVAFTENCFLFTILWTQFFAQSFTLLFIYIANRHLREDENVLFTKINVIQCEPLTNSQMNVFPHPLTYKWKTNLKNCRRKARYGNYMSAPHYQVEIIRLEYTKQWNNFFLTNQMRLKIKQTNEK